MNDLPQNGGYMVAAYVVTAVIYLAYTVSLVVRVRGMKKKADSQ